MTRNQIRMYRRHIPQSERGPRTETKAEYDARIHRQAQYELVKARSEGAAEAFLNAFSELERAFELEDEARRKLGRVLVGYRDALDLGEELATSGSIVPQMICSRVLARMAPALRHFFDLRLEEIFRVEVSEPGCPSPREEWNLAPDVWAAAIAYLSFPRRPSRRTTAFMALKESGALGPPGDFRTLAAASLLAGCGTLEFVPGYSTLAHAFDYETKRMREVAHRENPAWAAPRTGQIDDEADPPRSDSRLEDDGVLIVSEPVALYAA